MRQSEHLFQFTGKAIAEAAEREAVYHKTRLEHWLSEQARIVGEARELTATVRVREQAVTGGKRYEIYADIVEAQTLNWQLQTCGAKIDEHRRLSDEYGLRAAAYRTQESRAYELDPSADVAYFRLAGGARSE